MAKISTYVNDSTPSLSDKLIGTDVDNLNATKNFTISQVLSLANLGNFVPYAGANANVNLGSFNLTANSVIKSGGTSSQFLKADGSVDSTVYTPISSLSGYVPYTGATGGVDLGIHTIRANSFVKQGGTASQFLKADGSVDTNTYALASSITGLVPYTGATSNVNLGSNSITANSIIKLGGTSSQFLKADGSVDSNTYLTTLNLSYGSFYDTLIQTAAAVLTPYPIRLNSVDSAATSGISVLNDGLGNPTLIKLSIAGVYNIAFSAQIQRTTGGSIESINFWIRKNGVDVPWTNTIVAVQANAQLLVAAWNFFIACNPLDEVQLMWSTSSTSISMTYAGATPYHPETPSVILTVNKVS